MRRARAAIEDDERLTQYGNRVNPICGRPFKNRPPYPDECNALSLIRGERTIAEAVSLIRTSRSDTVPPGAGVRYTIAARLKDAGFALRANGNNRNPHHVSVICMDEKRIWTEDDSMQFDACFEEPLWEGGVTWAARST
jgi:hypothetical protein